MSARTLGELPEHRRALAGRTWSSVWAASDMDPVSHYRHRRAPATVRGVALAIVIGVALALVLAYGGGA